MLHLHDEQEQEYRHWSRKMLTLNWYLVALVLLVELSGYVLQQLAGQVADTSLYLINYLLLPGLGSTAIVGVTHLLCVHLLQKRAYRAQAIVHVIGMSLMALVLAWTHSNYALMGVLFTCPVFVSVVFNHNWPLNFAYLLNLALFLLNTLWLSAYSTAGLAQARMPINMGIMVALLTGAWLISRLLLQRQQGLVNAVSQAYDRSRHDSLTGLYNHAAFYDEMDERIMRHNSDGCGFGLIIFDLDNFKRINDQFGHAVGDVVITTLVAVVRGCLGEGDEAFRYGGEEFTVLANRDAEGCMALAKGILERFRETMADDSWSGPVTVSAGVCMYDKQRFGAKREFFAAADEALYEAKRNGKDRAALWSEGLGRLCGGGHH